VRTWGTRPEAEGICTKVARPGKRSLSCGEASPPALSFYLRMERIRSVITGGVIARIAFLIRIVALTLLTPGRS
jgi:hypothetical protein